MKKITVETRMQSPGVPIDEETFFATGGAFVLKADCARQLLAEGCAQESIELGPPSFVDGEWTIQGTGRID